MALQVLWAAASGSSADSQSCVAVCSRDTAMCEKRLWKNKTRHVLDTRAMLLSGACSSQTRRPTFLIVKVAVCSVLL